MILRHDDADWMRLALQEAQEAQVRGEVPVGAVVVRDGQLLAVGRNAPVALQDPSAHAEMLALRAAAAQLGNYRLEGCTVYVTLEPCAMCAGAMLHARVARVVFGAPDPKTGAAGSVLNLFDLAQLNHQTAVQGGVLAPECGHVLRQFFQQRRQSQRAQALQASPLRDDALRTPPARLAPWVNADWALHSVTDLPPLAGLRLVYRDEAAAPAQAAASAPAWLFLHDADGWGARMAAVVAPWLAAGQRVVVPDLIGFGQSDKPKKERFHSPEAHAHILAALCERLALTRVVVVAQGASAALVPALCQALGPRMVGWMPLPAQPAGNDQDQAAAEAPFADAGYRAGPRAWARWPVLATAGPSPVPQPLVPGGPSLAATAQLAMEYFA